MTAEEERAAIVAWLNNCRAEHEKHAHRKGQKSARRHHIDACRLARTMRPDAAYRDRRLAQFDSARRERYWRNVL